MQFQGINGKGNGNHIKIDSIHDLMLVHIYKQMLSSSCHAQRNHLLAPSGALVFIMVLHLHLHRHLHYIYKLTERPVVLLNTIFVVGVVIVFVAAAVVVIVVVAW